MRRRALLSLFAGLTAGCLSAARTDTPTEPPSADSLPPTGDGALPGFDASDPFESRTVGTPSEAEHRILIWNDDVDRRRIEVRLRDVSNDVVVLDAEPRFPAYGSVRVEVFRQADFVLEVTAPEQGSRRFGVPREFVDCTRSATQVAVRPDGSVRARVVSTALGCDSERDADGDGPSADGSSTGHSEPGAGTEGSAASSEAPSESSETATRTAVPGSTTANRRSDPDVHS